MNVMFFFFFESLFVLQRLNHLSVKSNFTLAIVSREVFGEGQHACVTIFKNKIPEDVLANASSNSRNSNPPKSFPTLFQVRTQRQFNVDTPSSQRY